MKNNNQGKLLTIALGVILAISAGVLAYLAVSTKPPKLSEEKMQKAAEAAEAAKKENISQAEGTEEEDGEPEPMAKSIKSFQLTAGTSSLSGSASANGEQEADSDEKDDEDSGEDEEDDAENSYLCAYSSDRLMTEEDVQELQQGTYADLPQGKGIIRMVVNELYAKYGYQFGNEEIQAYFNQKEWYQDIPTRNTDMNDVIKKMTDAERANVEFLSPYIEEE